MAEPPQPGVHGRGLQRREDVRLPAAVRAEVPLAPTAVEAQTVVGPGRQAVPLDTHEFHDSSPSCCKVEGIDCDSNDGITRASR